MDTVRLLVQRTKQEFLVFEVEQQEMEMGYEVPKEDSLLFNQVNVASLNRFVTPSIVQTRGNHLAITSEEEVAVLVDKLTNYFRSINIDADIVVDQ